VIVNCSVGLVSAAPFAVRVVVKANWIVAVPVRWSPGRSQRAIDR